MDQPIRLTAYSRGGGCGCKIAPSVLQEILQLSQAPVFPQLLVGNETADDAAVYAINNEEALISTADFFMPIVDDAYDFGRIAAANALSDVYAMGGRPLMALALLGWPLDKLPPELASRVLEGARAVCNQAGIPLAGGHSIDSSDPIFGLAVTGRLKKNQLKKNSGAKAGDLIFLTKPLGVGILSTALKREVLEPGHYQAFISQLTSLNQIGEELAALDAVHALTDVTGFGLLGHLIEMAEGSGLSMDLDYNRIQKIEGLDHYLAKRTIPDATFRNWNSYSHKVQFEKGVNVMEAFNLLPDPQTNGGLLIAVAPEGEAGLKKLLKEKGYAAFQLPIGRARAEDEKSVYVHP